MSMSVAWGHVAPAGKHHPTAKWSLLMVLLAVVVLGVPKVASAALPSVQAPTGPQSGGYFIGTYTFDTYIYCSNGVNFSSTYSNSLDGTHTFTFFGTGDGSLLVSIDGGGHQLVTSCGDPTGSDVQVASYTVSEGSPPPPSPTPTPTPTPSPTATPAPTSTPTSAPTSGGTSGNGTSGGSSAGGTTSSSNTSGGTTSSSGVTNQANGSASSAGSTPAAAPTSANSGGAPIAASRLRPHRPAGPAATPMSGQAPKPGVLVADASVKFALPAALLVGLGLLWWRRTWRLALIALGRRAAVRLEPYFFRFRQHLRAHDEPKPRGLSQHHHSGKLIAHHHTSYPALAFLILLATVVAAAASLTSFADSQLSLTVLGPPPAASATIDQPADGGRVSDSSLTVRGTCPLGLAVEIYRNGLFAGSTACGPDGLYNVLITLIPGTNTLVARDVDALNQYGPDSTSVSVVYTPITPPTPTPTPSATPTPVPGPVKSPRPSATPRPSRPTPVPAAPPFYIVSTVHSLQASSPDNEVIWPVQIHGGDKPYFANWNWDDGRQDTSTYITETSVTGTHRYTQPGTYHVTLRLVDSAGRESTFSILAVVAGVPAVSSGNPGETSGAPVVIWPLLTITGLITLSFWLGEHHKQARARFHALGS